MNLVPTATLVEGQLETIIAAQRLCSTSVNTPSNLTHPVSSGHVNFCAIAEIEGENECGGPILNVRL